MLVVDASCLYEVLVDGARSDEVRLHLADDPQHAAPHVVDVEVLSVIRREHSRGRLDPTMAAQAINDLFDWPGQRYGHRALLWRAWELRDSVRTWDAIYVALAEALEATFLTADARLAGAAGPACRIQLVGVGET